MRDRLTMLGWAQIETVDDDLGRSAAGTTARAGFERMVAEVCLGKVGAVVAREVSRFARNSRDWQQLIEMCRVVDTVLIDQETVYAPRQGNDRLLLGLKGSLNEYELDLLRQRSLAARYEKARRDELLVTAPIGFALDVQGLGPELHQPLPQSPGNHLRAVIGTNMLRHTLGQHGVRQRLDHPEAVDPPRHPQGQTFPCELIDERHDPQAPSIMGVTLDKVEAPEMIGSLGPQPNARAIIEPEPDTRLVLLRDLKPLATPDALHPIPPHLPANPLQQGGDPAVAVAPIL
jgi:hypothetical protein